MIHKRHRTQPTALLTVQSRQYSQLQCRAVHAAADCDHSAGAARRCCKETATFQDGVYRVQIQSRSGAAAEEARRLCRYVPLEEARWDGHVHKPTR